MKGTNDVLKSKIQHGESKGPRSEKKHANKRKDVQKLSQFIHHEEESIIFSGNGLIRKSHYQDHRTFKMSLLEPRERVLPR